MAEQHERKRAAMRDRFGDLDKQRADKRARMAAQFDAASKA